MLPDVHYDAFSVYLGRMDSVWIYPLNMLQWSDAIEKADALLAR